jgi:D-sedoheptulose 7-phosphate isomerase
MIDAFFRRYAPLQPLRDDILRALALLKQCSEGKGRIFTCGNGGSAADAEHIVGELLKGFHLKRRLTDTQVNAIAAHFPGEAEAIAGTLQQSIAAISLVSQVSLMTAVANDTDPIAMFAQQLYGLGRAGDVLLAISTSGNSANVLLAAKVARVLDMKVIALTGADGGALEGLADVSLNAPASRVDHVQELHLPIYHLLCAALEETLFGSGMDLPDPEQRTPTAPDAGPSLPTPPRIVVFDFDGVFTDNRVYTLQDGSEAVACDRRDGLGTDALKAAGIPMFILSKETNPVVQARAAKIGIDNRGGCDNKRRFLAEYFEEHGIDAKDAIYMGNDLNDLEAMEFVGYPVCPADAHPQIKSISRLVLSRSGGDGAVRELCDLILKNTGA